MRPSHHPWSSETVTRRAAVPPSLEQRDRAETGRRPTIPGAARPRRYGPPSHHPWSSETPPGAASETAPRRAATRQTQRPAAHRYSPDGRRKQLTGNEPLPVGGDHFRSAQTGSGRLLVPEHDFRLGTNKRDGGRHRGTSAIGT